MSNAPLIDRAIAHARREAYRTAVSMTSAELRDCITWYISNVGQPTEEALVQERMVRGILARREASVSSRTREASRRDRALSRKAR